MKGVLIIFLLAFVIVTNISMATSGSLDAKGCHNSKTQGYHCHRSQPSTAPITSSSSLSTSSTSGTRDKILGQPCVEDVECFSNVCFHNYCRNNKNYFIGDKYCDSAETCLNSPDDCGPCDNNGICEIEANETCAKTNDCTCKNSQLCLPERKNKNADGCYDITCGDGIIDYGERSDNCCLDVKCPTQQTLIKETFCNNKTRGCEMRFKNWLKITSAIIIVLLAIFIYNRASLKKSHRHK